MESTAVYRAFLGALNRQDLAGAADLVAPDRYRENCVGFTPGWVGWEDATASLATIWAALPDLHVDLDVVAASGDDVLAHGTVRGTATGRLYGAPATGRTYTADFFDHVRLAEGRIVERVQQSDVLGQMRQLYGRVVGSLGLAALLWRLPATPAAVDPRGATGETLLEHAGGAEAVHRLEEAFYASVLRDPLLVPLFGSGRPEHVDHLTAFTVESFGGPDRFTRELGFGHLIATHRGLAITEEQRRRFVELYLQALDTAGLPADGPFRDAVREHVEFGSRVAMQNSHATTDAELHPLREVPRWTWPGDRAPSPAASS